MRYGGLIIAVIFAAIAAVVVLRMSAGETQPPVAGAPISQDVKTANIYVAKTPITIGTTVSADMVATQPWPENLLLPGFMQAKDGAPTVVGKIARAPFQQNEPFIEPKLTNPNDPNFLAGELPKGMRVVTMPANEVDGVAGFIFPGDHVDVLFTHSVPKWETPPVGGGAGETPQPVKTATTITETLLTNVKVLAVDQRPSGTNATDKNGNLIIPRSVSLMVSQSDAQRVRLAQSTGTLSLALRAVADKESADPLMLTGAKDITQTKQNDSDVGAADGSVKVVRGAPIQNKEIDAGNASAARGAPGAAGIVPNTPNPALVAIP